MALEASGIARGPTAPRKASSLGMRFARGVKARDRMLFLEQLTLLLETGASLHSALGTLRKACVQPKLGAVLEAMSEDIAAGRSFSSALSRHPQVFSQTHVNLIAASENGGFMPDVLKQLLQMEERREKLRATVASAAAYPAFLSVFSVGVVLFVLVVVFPKFGAMFASIRDELPLSTKLLMACSDFLRGYWMQCLAVSAVAVFALVRWARSESGGELLDGLKIRAPLIGAVFVKLYIVQSLRAMSLSLANGVSAVETLTACHEVVPNRLYKRFLARVRRNIEDGGSLAAGFNRASFIPPMVRQLISTGDESGNLAKVMSRIADYYERELEKQLGLLSRLAEPVMLLIMGVLVGLIVSSLILPIFKLSRAVG